MNSKERMLCALHREKPDRLPVTIHQWQDYHLQRYMGGRSALEAFQYCGLDASIQYGEAGGQFWAPYGEGSSNTLRSGARSCAWTTADPENRVVHHTIHTPGGTLTYATGANAMTVWVTEHLIKRPDDIDLIRKYMPVPRLDHAAHCGGLRRGG